jgi:hypothetical protein
VPTRGTPSWLQPWSAGASKRQRSARLLSSDPWAATLATAQRGLLQFQMVSLGMTLAAMVVAVLGLAVVVSIPIVINFIRLTAHAAALIYTAAMMIMVAFIVSSIAELFRIGPSRTREAASALFLERLLPPCSAASRCIADLLCRPSLQLRVHIWLDRGGRRCDALVLLTAYAVLVGAEFNAQLEIA